ncbi:mannose-6-phosphate isomerase, class I [Salinibacterium soli]|uniref:mannose-6-phosphate isomerase n=1 Tax=Antiquaquibacter soli TaxID=3064523 RepID=A0ABT9BKQ3_9MICO|nr:mannose-6-phosphate isomerase, class I [Protaetiibacter sp. WY-16]MDO7881139.1 mannose-6-phosphate isomerase, class I [Protaetiibacter sp. WY-16]
MFVAITNTPRDYAWGSSGAISELLGAPATDAVEAELWLGAHHGSPSRILDPTATDGAGDLAQWIAADPATATGDEDAATLPFLLKVLAARSPLSLQAHPTPEQAAAGFAREDAAGIPIDAAHRNYKDPYAKPELILAVSEEFGALCGFRPAAESRRAIARLLELAEQSEPDARGPLTDWLERLSGDDSIQSVFEWLISRGEGVDELVAAVARVVATGPGFATQRTIAETYPGDPGLVISLLLHEVTLAKGEALFLPAGNIHAYLHGVGIELMSSSDNVLRGGLTPKHVDVAELLSVLDFRPLPAPYLVPEVPVPDVRVFHPEGTDFELVEFEASGLLPLDGPAIALCLEGSFELTGGLGSAMLSRGDVLYITPDEGDLAVGGTGQLVVATVVG